MPSFVVVGYFLWLVEQTLIQTEVDDSCLVVRFEDPY
jgi:hypothetical protein